MAASRFRPFLIMGLGVFFFAPLPSGTGFSGVETAWAQNGPPSSPPASSEPVVPADSTIYGIVLSEKDRTPLSGVPVRIRNKGTGKTLATVTNGQGAYIFTLLPPGTYEILVGGGFFTHQRKEGFLGGGMVGKIDFSVRPLSHGTASLSGTVFEAGEKTRPPLQASLKIKNLKTGEIYLVISGEKGHYLFNGIPAGSYLLLVTRKEFAPFVEKIAVLGRTVIDVPLSLNSLARAEIRAQGNRKIRETTGAITEVDQKKFEQNLSGNMEYTLMENSPGISYYSRDGSQGVSGGMYYLSCRGYNVGGANATPTELSAGVEVSVDGVPLNNEADGGEIFDPGIMNEDIKSATVQRGVTTSRQLGNFAAGCAIDIQLKEPTKTPYQTVNGGGGSYGLYYASYINNTGIGKETNAGAYNDFTMLRQDGFRQFTNMDEYQYYGNFTKYLTNGKLYLLATANYQDYDRGGSISLANYNAYGPTDNGGPSLLNPTNPGNTSDSPFYHNLNYFRSMLDLGFKDQVTPEIRITNSLFAILTPYGDSSAPAGFGSCNGASCTQSYTAGSTYQTINPNYSNQLGYSFLDNFYKAEGYKAGDIAEIRITPWKNDSLYLGMRGSYSGSHYFTNPEFSNNIIGGTANALYSQTTIGAYLEDQFRPVPEILLKAGFRVMAVEQSYTDLVPGSFQSSFPLSEVGANNGGAMVIPMPHIGLNYYPSDHWKIYANGGESFSEPVMFDYKGFLPGSLSGGISPETVWDLGVGTRYSTSRGFAGIDFFSDYLQNMPVAVPITSGQGLNYQYLNVGAARRQGIETEGQVNLGAGFSLSANFTYMDGVLGNTPIGNVNFQGDMTPFLPLDMGNLALSYNHGPYHLTIDERYTGMMNVIDFTGGPIGTENNQVNVPGYFTTDLYATYDLPVARGWYKSASLYLEAYNLLNTNYYNPAGLEPSPSNSTMTNLETLFLYPGEPVNIFAGLKVTF